MAPSACPFVFTTHNPHHHPATITVSSGHRRPRIQQPPRQWPNRIIPSSLLATLTTLAVLTVAAWIPGATASALPAATPTPTIGSHHTHMHPHPHRHDLNLAAKAEHEKLERYRHQALRKRDESSTLEVILSTDITLSTLSTQGATTTTVVTSSLPSPFDGSLAANFQGSDSDGECPEFINSFLTDSTFKACYPFSLLVQGSQGFFEAEKSAVAMTQILQVSCAASVETCAPYLAGLAEELLLEDNCKSDYELDNQVVHQAYDGLRAYKELYAVSCLKDEDEDGYCFTNAVTNYTSTSDTYLYLLPLNMSLPSAASPSCDWCVKNNMDIYQSAAADRTLPIAELYEDAANQVNGICGVDFVNATLPIATVESSAGRVPLDTILAVTSTAVCAAIFFQFQYLV